MDLLTVRETARRLGVHENTVRNWDEKGVLTSIRLPGSGFRRFDAGQIAHMEKEMFSQLAPGTTGPEISPRAASRGRILHGDDLTNDE